MPNQHVVPHNGKWAVKREGSSRATIVTNTQAEAIQRAREISQNQHTELIILGKNGAIRARDSHGHDPFPPKG